jgi:nicotinamide mononucleotide adenylyltransferase
MHKHYIRDAYMLDGEIHYQWLYDDSFTAPFYKSDLGESMPEITGRLREVPEMNEAIWADAYDYLENSGRIGQVYLDSVTAAIERGYTPDEIYHQIMREAGSHRQEIAERCRAAAKYLTKNR